MKLLRLIDHHIEEWLLIVTYTAMLIIATAQVFFRYVVNYSISWSQDLLTFMLIWSVFIGISLAVKHRRHIKVEIAFVLLSKRAQFILRVMSNIIFMIFCAIFSYFSLKKVYSLIFINPQISESTGLSMWMIQIAIPIEHLPTRHRYEADL